MPQPFLELTIERGSLFVQAYEHVAGSPAPQQQLSIVQSPAQRVSILTIGGVIAMTLQVDGYAAADGIVRALHEVGG